MLATIAGVAVLAAWQALRLGLGAGLEPGPGMFPLAVAVVVFGLACATLAAIAREPRGPDRAPQQQQQQQQSQPGPAPAPDAASDVRPARRVAWYAATILAWSFTLPWLGFTVSSALALVAILRGAERQPWWVSLAFAAVAALACRWLFETLLGVPLPHGSFQGR